MSNRLIIVQAKDYQIPWQIHSIESWRDPVTGEQETYIAGFSTKEKAEKAIAHLESLLS